VSPHDCMVQTHVADRVGSGRAALAAPTRAKVVDTAGLAQKIVQRSVIRRNWTVPSWRGIPARGGIATVCDGFCTESGLLGGVEAPLVRP
jgi:hypothetical protein